MCEKSKYLDFFIRIRQIVIYQEIIKVLKMTNITLPNDWQWKKLGEMLDVRDGTHDSPKYLTENGYPFVTSKNLKENGLDLENVNLISESDYFNFNKRSKVDKGDLLLAMIGTIGNPIIVEIEPNFAIKNVALIKANENVVMMKFLKFFFTSQATINKMQDESNGATQKFVSLKYLRNFPIPLPPLEEQKRIVAKIDAAFEQLDEAISLQKNNILRTETLKKALLVEQFSELPNEKKDILDVAKISNKTILPNDDEIYNYVGLENIEKETRKLVDFNPQMGSQIKSNKVFFKKNMVLYGKLRPYLNKVWVANFDGIATTEILPFECKASMNPHFLAYYLSSPEFVSKVSESTQGARMPRLRTEFWKEEAQIPVPSIAEQEKIVAYLDNSFAEIDKMLAAQKTRLAHLEGMKKAILQEAFEGKL